MPRYVGWSRESIALVEKACSRHGGWGRYECLNEVSAELIGLGGPLPLMKGLGRTFVAPAAVIVNPREQRTVFVDWPAKGDEGSFTRGDVRTTRQSGESTISEAHRARMSRSRWSPLDALYFFGYALANYFALPFLLASTHLVGYGRRSVVVEFPPGLDTHSRRQAFYFDGSGLLVRHDYTADVVSVLAMGSHYSSSYVDVDGLWFATERRVVGRLGAVATPLPVLHASIRRFRVRYGTEEPQASAHAER